MPDLSYFQQASKEEREKLRLLRVTRMGYAQERLLHNFLVDAYVGGGGFQNGLIPAPDAPFWGRRAYERGNSTWTQTRDLLTKAPPVGEDPKGAYCIPSSYLVPFSGEEYYNFLDRIRIASYENPVEKIVRFTNALLMQNDAQRENVPKELSTWAQRVDSQGRSLNQVERNQVLHGQVFGWGATLIDTPKLRATSLADSMRRGLLPYCTVVCPQEILDYDRAPDGHCTAVKLSFLCEHKRMSMFDLKLWEEHILYWYEDRWERYVILLPPAETCSDTSDPELGRLVLEEKGPNPQPGVIPLAFFSWDEGLGGLPGCGLPQIFNIAKAAWSSFQINSELRHMMRMQVFSQLVMEQAGKGSVKGNVALGPGNFITETAGFAGNTRYITPPAAPAQVYEARIDALNEHLHRMSGVDSGSKKISETAEAMRIRFQQTEAMLTNGATNAETYEKNVLTHVGRLFGIGEEALARISVVRPKNFDVGRYSAQIKDTIDAFKLPWGKQAYVQMQRRMLRSVVPNANPADMARLDAEVEATVEANYDRFLEMVLKPEESTAAPPDQQQQPPPPT